MNQGEVLGHLQREYGGAIYGTAEKMLEMSQPMLDFTKTEKRHDWKNYVPPAVQEVWPHLPLLARWPLFLMAEELAFSEDWD